jgi:hypothetical protein
LWRQTGRLQTTLVSKVGKADWASKDNTLLKARGKADRVSADNTRLKGRGKQTER